jgi:outer membrane protein
MASTPKSVLVQSLRVLSVAALLAAPVAAQQAAKPMKIGIIDPDRIVAESQRGKVVVAALNKARDERVAQGNKLKQEISELQKQIDAGRLSLGEAKLKQLNDQLEEKTISFQRFGENAQRELGKMEQEQMGPLEQEILRIINQIGAEQGYTLIFKKFQSGLVYADETTDLSPIVIQRFDAGAGAAPAAKPAAAPAPTKPPGH